MKEKIKSGILGLAVGDALGVPVEFESRDSLEKDPVTGMRGFGTHNQPAGTWSDDTSMTLCLMDTLSNGLLDIYDLMDRFLGWMQYGDYTASGKLFDIGIGTQNALNHYKQGMDPDKCGLNTENDNGNGSLMRILPMAFYEYAHYDMEQEEDHILRKVHEVSALTHAHPRSLIACGVYVLIAMELMNGNNGEDAVEKGMNLAVEWYKKQPEFKDNLSCYSRLLDKNFRYLLEDDIKSTGYVVDTLEAAIWCLLNTKSYEECVLKAVNLGNDTDTVAAVAGGLAGLLYGWENIPQKWLDELIKRDYIESLCQELAASF